MTLKDTTEQLESFVSKLLQDLNKVHRGNKAAAQRVRVGTISLEKVAKTFRKESVELERTDQTKKLKLRKKKKQWISNSA